MKIKHIKATIEPYESKFFPVKARWKVNGVGYCAVFETVQQARNYLTGKFYGYVDIREVI